MKLRLTRRGGHRLAGIGAVAMLCITTGANAGTLYRLHDHPDGNAAPPTYGLRLDELVDVTAGHDVFTFSFDVEGAAMWLYHDEDTIEIWGRAFGGHQSSSTNQQHGWVDIEFTYENVTKVPGDDHELWVLAGNPTNSGTITLEGSNTVIPLFDYTGSHGFSFRFGDEDDDQGHRGFPGISGWGWLNHGSGSHIAASDWLFTAEVVPAPPAVLLGIAGLGIAAVARRRAVGRRT